MISDHGNVKEDSMYVARHQRLGSVSQQLRRLTRLNPENYESFKVLRKFSKLLGTWKMP
jgi:hypothetical protein